MGKIALITGATSGFGKSAVELFIKNGWKVIGTGRRKERLDALKAELGENFYGLAFDIQNTDQIASVIDSIPKDFQSTLR